MPLLPNESTIDWNTDPLRTTKGITVKCTTPITEVEEENLGGNTFKFTQRMNIDVYVRNIKARGLRLGREPPNIVAMEKHLIDYLATNRLTFQEDGIQYVEVIGSQTYPEIMGSENMQQVWYHLEIYCRLHYWMRATVV